MVEFDRQKFAASLESVQNQSSLKLQTQPLDFSLHIFDSLSSTNQKVWELLSQGAAPLTVAIALQQEAGRGQWGRQWHSSPGGLYLSLALAPKVPAQQGTQLTLCSAWGIATALRQYNLPVLLKWPNDLILSGRKLGGILTETRVKQGCITKAVVGVGINLTNPVPETGINLQSFLRNHSRLELSLEKLAAITLAGVVSGYQFWQQEGINRLLASYQQLLTSLGQKIEVNGRAGVVIGISATGDLQIRLFPQGVQPCEEICLQPGTISLGYGLKDQG